MSTNATHIPAKFAATNGDGETFDLRSLNSKDLSAYKREARTAGDTEAVRNCDAILTDRGWGER